MLMLRLHISGNDKPFGGVAGAKMYGTIVKLNLSNNHIHANGIRVLNPENRNPPFPTIFLLVWINQCAHADCFLLVISISELGVSDYLSRHGML
jgi:hypothetical protein